jgi:hypothetical protein
VYHCTMVQRYTQYNPLHNNTKILHPHNLINTDNQLFIKLSDQFQTISDRFISQKSPKITVFSAKNASKNTVFGSFFIKNHQKYRFFTQKLGQKPPENALFGHILHRLWHTP